MEIFEIGKRVGEFYRWEPIYIGTNSEPFYDERLSWEGRRDKMSQGYALCVLDYEFHILNNGFLVHKPGIKRVGLDDSNHPSLNMQIARDVTSRVIGPELRRMYGKREGCRI